MAIDWTASMQQTFEYYEVDPESWFETTKLNNVTSCSVVRDASSETLGSAQIDVTESLGESYVRAYLIAIQNGVTYRVCLGTFLVQTPSSSFDGKVRTVSMDAYTPLLELKESPIDYGYTILKGYNVMEYVCNLTQAHARAPVVTVTDDTEIYRDFTANTDDTWLSFLSDFMAYAKYSFALDEKGRILYAPDQKLEAMQPVYTYTDDNSSLLYSDISMDHDLYGIPNVVEVIYSNDSGYLFSRVENNDENSPISIVNRGREILYRDTSPSLSGTPTQDMVDEYAEQLLESLSEVEYTVSYEHGYCDVRLGDCVRLNYQRAEIADIKAKVTYQSISCEPGCPVEEKATFTTKLWEG